MRWTLPRGCLLLTAGLVYLLFRFHLPFWNPFHGDQFPCGNLPHALLSGRVMPVAAYQWPMHVQAALVFAPLITLLYAVFGQYNFLMNALILAMTTATAVLWVHLADRHHSRRLAACVALVFAAAFPFWNFMSTHLWQVHMESCLFSILQLALLFRIVSRGSAPRAWLGLGLLAGLSTLVSLHNLVTVAVTLAFLVLSSERLRQAAARLLLYLVGHAAAFAPSVYMNLRFGRWFLYYRGIGAPPPAGERPDSVLGLAAAKLDELFRIVLPRLPGFVDPTFNAIYMLFVLAGLLAVILAVTNALRAPGTPWYQRVRRLAATRPIEVAIVLTMFFFLLLYTLGPMRIPEPRNRYFYRYLMPVIPAMMASLAYLFTRLGRAAVPAAAVFAALTIGQIARAGEAHLLSLPPDAWLTARSLRGHDVIVLYTENVPWYVNSRPRAERPAVYREILEKTPPAERWIARYGLGRWLADQPDAMAELPAAQDARAVIQIAEGFAARWTEEQVSGRRPAAPTAAEVWGARFGGGPDPDGVRRALARGAGLGVLRVLTNYGLAVSLDVAEGRDHPKARRFARPPDAALAAARGLYDALPADLRREFASGMGWGAANDFSERCDHRRLFAAAFGELAGWEDAFRGGVARGLAEYLLRYYFLVPAQRMRELLDAFRPCDPPCWNDATRARLLAELEKSLRDYGAALRPLGRRENGEPAYYEVMMDD